MLRLVGALSLILSAAYAQPASSMSLHSQSAEARNQVFVYQNNVWVNLHHFLRAEAFRRSRGLPLQLPLETLNPDEQSAWQSALDVYSGLAKRAYISAETLTRMDNALAMLSGPTIHGPTAIDPKFVAALNRAASIYRAHRWIQVQLQNRHWIAAHSDSIQSHAPAITAALGKVFGVTPPSEPILWTLSRILVQTSHTRRMVRKDSQATLSFLCRRTQIPT